MGRREEWDAPLPTSRSDRARSLAMPLLLVLVAALGVYRSVTLDQSSWQGASFGMFATYDNRSSRSVVVQVRESGVDRTISLSGGLREEAIRLLVVPTDGAADALADRVLDRLAEADRAVVEVRRLVIDDERGLRVSLRRLARGEARR